jgi:hypothetical protein
VRFPPDADRTELALRILVIAGQAERPIAGVLPGELQ